MNTHAKQQAPVSLSMNGIAADESDENVTIKSIYIKIITLKAK